MLVLSVIADKREQRSAPERSEFILMPSLITKTAGTFLSKVNIRETIVAIEAKNYTYFLQKRLEGFSLKNFPGAKPFLLSFSFVINQSSFNNIFLFYMFSHEKVNNILST